MPAGKHSPSQVFVQAWFKAGLTSRVFLPSNEQSVLGTKAFAGEREGSVERTEAVGAL